MKYMQRDIEHEDRWCDGTVFHTEANPVETNRIDTADMALVNKCVAPIIKGSSFGAMPRQPLIDCCL